jgi:hypothetical protein
MNDETDWLDWDDRTRLVVHDNSTSMVHAEREIERKSTTEYEREMQKMRERSKQA